MKNFILTTFLLLCGLPLFSQTYVPFPTDSTVWRTRYIHCDGPYYCTGFEEFDFILGDTILEDKLYSRVYKVHDPFYPFELGVSNGVLNAYIREEDKRVYLKNPIGVPGETLLYDFNLGVGDTIHWDINVINDPYSDVTDFGVIQSIDSVQMITGEYRKVYRVSLVDWRYTNIIEGIGSHFGLLRPNVVPFESSYDILCVADMNTLIHNSGIRNYSTANQCLYTPVSTAEALTSAIKAFPNPTNGVLYFSQTLHDAQIELYTLTGEKVLSIDRFTGSEINVEYLPLGIYFLWVDGNEKLVEKLVKN